MTCIGLGRLLVWRSRDSPIGGLARVSAVVSDVPTFAVVPLPCNSSVHYFKSDLSQFLICLRL